MEFVSVGGKTDSALGSSTGLPGIDSQVASHLECQLPGGCDAEASLKYLAPYVFRVAISDSRIVAAEGRQVTFSLSQIREQPHQKDHSRCH